MEGRIRPRLLVSKDEAEEKIRKRIEKGQTLHDRQIDSEDELEKSVAECRKWSNYNRTLLLGLFFNSSVADGYGDFNYQRPFGAATNPLAYPPLEEQVNRYQQRMATSIHKLEEIRDELELFDEPSDIAPRTSDNIGTHVFIGHGRSQDWRELKDFISDKLKLPWDEFNRVPIAGLTNITRLAEMLDQACMAFLVMTAEDEQADGKLRARENVVHEAGLFQGRLGFKKAIILLEEGCQEFSNIHGLGQIRFPKGNIKATFEDIREVLKREGILA